jgi:hypothetical protein
MQYEDFSNTLTQAIRNSSTTFSPFTGSPFQSIPSQIIQVIAGRDFDLCLGTEVKDTAGRAYFIVAAHWLPGSLCLVSLVPQETSNV